MRWVIQRNLVNSGDSDRIKETCIKYGYDYDMVEVIPFTNSIPDIRNDSATIFYGATNFISNIYNSKRWEPGTYYNPETFTMKAYVENYKESMINSGCIFSTIGEFSKSHENRDKLFFIRPVKDMKEFAGEVMLFDDILKWEKKLRYLPGCDNNPNLTLDTEIIVSEPYGIAHEWRLFVVRGKVSSGSHYRSYMRLDKVGGVSERVKDYVEGQAAIWSPAEVFVMDVCESGGNLYIVECNCFNSSGFYDSDVEKIIHDISEGEVR